MADSLARVKRATVRRAAADEEWRAAMRSAHAEGVSLRRIAVAAGVTHPHVLKIVRGA